MRRGQDGIPAARPARPAERSSQRARISPPTRTCRRRETAVQGCTDAPRPCAFSVALATRGVCQAMYATARWPGRSTDSRHRRPATRRGGTEAGPDPARAARNARAPRATLSRRRAISPAGRIGRMYAGGGPAIGTIDDICLASSHDSSCGCLTDGETGTGESTSRGEGHTRLWRNARCRLPSRPPRAAATTAPVRPGRTRSGEVSR